MEFSIFLNYAQSLRFEDKPDYPFLRKLFRDLFIRLNYDLDFLYDWTIAGKVSNTQTTSPNKLQIELKLNREVNASQMMNNQFDTVFQKGAGGGGAGAGTNTNTAAEKKSKFNAPGIPLMKDNQETAQKGGDGEDSSSSKDKKAGRKASDEKLIPGVDNSESDKQIKRPAENNAAAVSVKIPEKRPQLPLL